MFLPLRLRGELEFRGVRALPTGPLPDEALDVLETQAPFSSVQPLSCVRLFADPMDCSTPGFPVHHQLLEIAQTHIHQVSDAIPPSLLTNYFTSILGSPGLGVCLSAFESLKLWGLGPAISCPEPQFPHLQNEMKRIDPAL